MTRKMTDGKTRAMVFLLGSMLAYVVPAATAITIDKVVQRWPWNNKIDITYTIKGNGQNVAESKFYKIGFTTVIKDVVYTIDGSSVGASANQGTHTVTWTAPLGVKCSSCTMSATLSESDVPSGDDYMIIDLTKESDCVTYEGLYATQDISNERYNDGVYKNGKLVLRKVGLGAYPTGSTRYGSGNDMNSPKTWTTDRVYYIGVFPVTQYQYEKICDSNPSANAAANTGLRPVSNVSWNDLRLAGTSASSQIPVVNSRTGTFFQRLNFMTGNKFRFDLPTEVMFEIAQRAGATTDYFWGSDMNADYVVCSENCRTSMAAVGSRKPNSWGLYDMSGNVWELCLDVYLNSDMAEIVDPFTPVYEDGTENRRRRGGGAYSDSVESNPTYFRASRRGTGVSCSLGQSTMGFRVAVIVD